MNDNAVYVDIKANVTFDSVKICAHEEDVAGHGDWDGPLTAQPADDEVGQEHTGRDHGHVDRRHAPGAHT